jgi:UDP-galactose transporter B1
MGVVSVVLGGLTGELVNGWGFVRENTEVLEKIFKFSLCSALGQSFIFYTIANFDPLLLSTITTTRKILSVLISILVKGHTLSRMGWLGIAMSIGGVLSELVFKLGKGRKKA